MITDAKLKAITRSVPANGAGIDYFVARLSDDSWTENEITGNDVYSSRTTNGKITYSNKVFTAFPSTATKDEEVILDATSIISYDYLKGKTVTSLIVGTDIDSIVDSNGSSQNIGDWTFYSKENSSGQNIPELVLTLGEAEYSEISVNSECIANNNTNKSKADVVQTDGNVVITKDQPDGYFQLDISNILKGFTVTDAKVTLVSDRKDGIADGMLKLYECDNGWLEDEITYNNAPDAGKLRAESIFTDDGSRVGAKHTFDITDYLQEKAYNGNYAISFKVCSAYVTSGTATNSNVNIYRRTNSNAERVPSLVITVTNNPTYIALVEDKVNISLP